MASIPYYEHLMEILNTDRGLKRTARGMFKQVAWATAPMVIGGFFGGPPGAAVGGLAGLGLGYWFSSNYDSQVAVIRDLNDDQKRQIVRKVIEMVGDAFVGTLTLFMTSQKNQEALLELLWKFASGLKR